MAVEAAVWAPLCMEPAEWVDWQRLNPRLTREADRAERPCNDCPVSYAVGMRAVGLCNGTPGGDEVSGDNGVATMPRPATLPSKSFRDAEVEVLATLPCVACAHASVCRIKPTLEARLESLPVTLPNLDPAISVELMAQVNCSQFLRAKVTKAVGGFVVKTGNPAHPHYIRTPEHVAKIAESNRRRAAEKRAAAES